MKAAIVKEDGLIYVNEVPEEPKYEHYGLTQDDTEDFWDDVEEHKKALASAIDSAILVADQKEAKRFVWYNQTGGYVNIHDFVLKHGIYPIPDLQWEVKKFYNPTRFGISLGRRALAILKESSTEQESQEDLWKLALKQIESRIDFMQFLTKHFTITRRKP